MMIGRYSIMKCASVTLLFPVLNVISKASAADTTAYQGGTPHSTVVELTKDNFKDAIANDPANSLWLLKFYAPWCGHCKRLAPVLDQVAPQVSGKLSIGKIDCTQEKILCKQHKVKGYPTMKFSRDGKVHDYPGSRQAQSILDFAEKMSSSPIVLVESYEQALEQVASKSSEGVGFIAYHPDVKGESLEEMLLSTHLTQVFGQVARKNQAIANFALLSADASDIASFSSTSKDGFIVKVEENVASKPFVAATELDLEQVDDFVQKENFALVAALGPQNFHRLGRNGRPLMMGVVDASNAQQLDVIKKDLAHFAAFGAKELVDQYYFGYMDGLEFKRFLQQFNITSEKLPQYMALNVPTKEYWQHDDYTTVQDLAVAIKEGKIESKIATGRHSTGVLETLRRIFLANMPYSIVFVLFMIFVVVVLIAMPFIPNPDDLRPPYKNIKQAPETTSAKELETSKPGEKEETKKDK